MYGLVYANMMDYAKKEGFASGGSALPMIGATIAIVLLIILQLFAIQWLWNTVLVRVLSVARPLPSLLYTLGLLVLMAMVHPGYAVSTSA
jgi:hypothetical protein